MNSIMPALLPLASLALVVLASYWILRK